MHVLARWNSATAGIPDDQPALLLEGDWPVASPLRWSLDSVIDARHEEIDRRAAALAGETADRGRSADLRLFAELNIRELAYYLVKLLRVIAFFERCRRGSLPETMHLRVAAGRDDDYVALFKQLAMRRQIKLDVQFVKDAGSPNVAFPPNSAWRQVAGRLATRFNPRATSDGQPRVVLSGNPRFLDPVCAELLRRGTQVWWLYDRFAAGSWLRWRKLGVGQLVCDSSQGAINRFSLLDCNLLADLDASLSPAVAEWFRQKMAAYGSRQTRIIEQIRWHFERIQPTALIVDEDATPLPRAAIHLARRHGAPSMVVQHGAPCVRFGFAPLAADTICVWGEPSRRQLLEWGVDDSQVCVTGPVGVGAAESRRPHRRHRLKHFLLLATTPARDDRPDAVAFHLTRRTYAEMLRVAAACIANIHNATLTVKLHPRASDVTQFNDLQRQFPRLPVQIVRRRSLGRLIGQADCVLSCASSSGVEAAAAGASVIQLLPLGSGDILPADEWGFIGSARTEAELHALLGECQRRLPNAMRRLATCAIFFDPAGAVRRVVDVALHAGGSDKLMAVLRSKQMHAVAEPVA